MNISCFEVGHILKVNGLHFIVAKEIFKCKGCYFNKSPTLCHESIERFGTCLASWRDDKQNVIFVNLDKNRLPKKYLLTSKKK